MEWLVLFGKIAAWIIGTVAVLAAAGITYQLIAKKRDNRVQPGESISVSGRDMHLLCLGEQDGPTIILEAGGSNSSITSRKIQSEMAKFARVWAYDRAGYGFSDPINHSRTFDEITEDLDELLAQAGVAPTYLLVGESMGGLMVRNYSRHHPEKVAGVVLLDAAEEEHTFGRVDKLKGMQSTAAATSWLARFGVIRLLLNLAPERAGIPADTDPARRKEIVAEYSRPEFFKSAVYELEAYFSAPEGVRKSGGFGSLGSTPLVVVTHGKPLKGPQAFLEEGWKEAQERLVALSTNSKLVIAEHSGHAISLDQPELVVNLVRSLLAEIASHE